LSRQTLEILFQSEYFKRSHNGVKNTYKMKSRYLYKLFEPKFEQIFAHIDLILPQNSPQRFLFIVSES